MTPGIYVSLKVIEVLAPMAARATGLSEAHVGWGLVRLWHRSWSLKIDTVTRVGLSGIFGPDRLDELIAALVDVGLLEAQEGAWRVKGADAYLRLHEARSKGGKAAAANLKRGTKPGAASREVSREADTGTTPAGPRLEPGDSREQPPGCAPGLSPFTDHRSLRGSMSSPLEQPRAPAEDENTRWDLAAHGFVDWARNQAPQLGDPGPQVLDWARTWFRKHQPDDLEVPRVAFASFVVWASLNGRTPGWGLWLEPAVWEPRCDDARLASRTRRGGRAA